MGHFIPAKPSPQELAAFAELAYAGGAPGEGSSGSSGDIGGGGRRVILLTGYWPPTDIGIAGNRTFPVPPFPQATVSGKGILWDFKDGVVNYKKSGYDVIAFSPTYSVVKGFSAYHFPGPTDPIVIDPFWGKGTGEITVDYKTTSRFFWKTVAKYRPIAIMSFSRSSADIKWIFETSARNLARDQEPAPAPQLPLWVTTLQYLTFT